ncbi:MAG: hypothetical protein K0Q65_1842, partial [Clostridia bacterium]|nr:hypothetical protein [Clostridia bacterium]
FGANSKTNLRLSSKVRDYYDKDKILRKLTNSYLAPIEVIDIGPVIADNPYNTDIMGTELYQAVYAGRKRTIHYLKPKDKNISEDINIETLG